MNPLIAQLTHRSFDALADALRANVDAIVVEWEAAVREALPHLDRLTFDELKDSVPAILSAIADALVSTDPADIRRLVEQAPVQGLTRFRQNYSLGDILQEDRLLRAAVVMHVEGALGRQANVPEAAALHATVDVMLQQAVVTLVDEQKAKLRAAAERELKYLSFLSHDLNNNLSGVTIALALLRGQIAGSAGCGPDAVEALDQAQASIRGTIEGMRRLLDHERLRKGGATPRRQDVDLGAVARNLLRQFARDAAAKGLRLTAEVGPGSVARTDAELVGLVVQNLVGNAVKYGSAGAVRVGAERRPVGGQDRWVLWVSDEGPGIAAADVDRIFEAFRRGEAHGQEGVGLGLAIASQAARLLGAELSVESRVGAGSTFRLVLPPETAAGGERATGRSSGT
jgi:signal transduction histidine kinase